MNGKGECDYGENGCVAAQNLKTKVGKMEVQQKNDISDIKALWKNLDALRSMMNKFLIGFGIIFVLINLGLKFIPIGN